MGVDDVRAETERVRAIWDKGADAYDRQMRFWERVLFADGRRWACSHATGDVLEIAVGTGRNLAHYPSQIRLTGIDISEAMLARAGERRVEQGREADLRLGDAQRLEFADASFDTVVCTLSLCSIPDDRAAVAEAKRVLRPGGHLVLLEHVRSDRRWVCALQRLLQGPACRFAGDNLLREPLDHLRAEGLEIVDLERSKLGIVERVVARKV